MLDALGVQTLGDEVEVIVELTETGITIKPKQPATPLTTAISAMNLPVADWQQMEEEIEDRDRCALGG